MLSWLRSLIMIGSLSVHMAVLPTTEVQADSCKGQGVEGDLSGSADIAVIVGRMSPSCFSQPSGVKRQLTTYYTLEITCSTEQQAALDGVCSATPCPTSFFALRTAHFVDGRTEHAGFR